MGLVGRIQAWDFIWESFEMRRVLIFFFFKEQSQPLWGKQSLEGQEGMARHQLGSKCNSH